jgi:membrane-associated protease RseP (regulator of RpoE activity)
MITAEPQPTPFDLRFSVLGFPVRVHPLFWLMALVIGYGRGDGIGLLISIGVIFLSILVHELGHAIMFRRFGNDCHIVLHFMGGLAIPGREQGFTSWDYGSSFVRQPSLQEQIVISFAGPAAGFILAALVAAMLYGAGGSLEMAQTQAGIWLPFANLGPWLAGHEHLKTLVDVVLFVNIFWGLMNLLPVFPLDGGQISLALFVLRDPWRGAEQALWVSTVTAGIVAVISALMFKEPFMVLLFGSLAFSSYMALQQLGGGRRRPW